MRNREPEVELYAMQAEIAYRLTFPEIKDLSSAMRDILARRLDEADRRRRRLIRRGA